MRTAIRDGTTRAQCARKTWAGATARAAGTGSRGRTRDIDAAEAAPEARTDHRCILGILARRLAAERSGDRPALAADALDAMLRASHFDHCCVPRYLALAQERGTRELQVPIATEADIETRVIVWPVGARDTPHPHTDGWTVFVPVRGELVSIDDAEERQPRILALASRRPVILRPEDGVHHLVRNAGDSPALSVHVSGSL